jgi:hypothetical protein
MTCGRSPHDGFAPMLDGTCRSMRIFVRVEGNMIHNLRVFPKRKYDEWSQFIKAERSVHNANVFNGLQQKETRNIYNYDDPSFARKSSRLCLDDSPQGQGVALAFSPKGIAKPSKARIVPQPLTATR